MACILIVVKIVFNVSMSTSPYRFVRLGYLASCTLPGVVLPKGTLATGTRLGILSLIISSEMEPSTAQVNPVCDTILLAR